MVSRLCTVSPTKGENFYYWTLLLDFKGAIAFAETCRVNEIEFISFEKAGRARGLLANNVEWKQVDSDTFR